MQYELISKSTLIVRGGFFHFNHQVGMKYTRLTREQLEELHPEFSRFLATQAIDARQWEELKKEKPEVAEQELDVFSDLIWEGVLNRVEYLENISSQQMHLFRLDEKQMHLISVKLNNPEIDLNSAEGFAWFKKNWQSDWVEYLTASKSYSETPNRDKFELIQKGAVITKGDLYRWFDEIISG
ncbi:MAG: hypothetical protein RLZZ241_2027 [Bacteroidota bacterium]